MADIAIVRTAEAEWERHADKAAQLEARGEDYQWQAKAEYEAAKAAGATYRQIAERVGKSFAHIRFVCTAVHKSQAEVEGWTFAEAYAAAKGGRPFRPHGGTNEWYTPAPYIEAARCVLGKINLDPASCEEANRTVRAEVYFDEQADGLEQAWFGNVFLNPPYGEAAGPFVAKALEEYEAGCVKSAVLLLSAHATDNSWCQPLLRHTLCFTQGRISFDAPGGQAKGNALFGSLFVYLGPEPERFAEVFEQFGAVVRGWRLVEVDR